MIGLFKKRRTQTDWQRKVEAARSIMELGGVDSSGMTDEEVVARVIAASEQVLDAVARTGISADEAGRALASFGSVFNTG